MRGINDDDYGFREKDQAWNFPNGVAEIRGNSRIKIKVSNKSEIFTSVSGGSVEGYKVSQYH